MLTRFNGTFSLAALMLITSTLLAAPMEPPTQEVFFDARVRQPDYAGPGRELPEPADVDEVLLGYFGPDDPDDPEGGDMWCAAQLAVEEANRRGGYRGKKFRLVAGWSKDGWGTGVVQVTRMVYYDKVWAIVGGIDGASTHLAEQVVAKARLPLLSPGSTDKTVNLINMPWMFSCLPADPSQAAVLSEAIEANVGESGFLTVSAADHDSHRLLVELKKRLTRRGMNPRYHFEYAAERSDLDRLTKEVALANVDAVVLIAGVEDSTRLVVALRGQGFQGTIFGGPAMGRRHFAEQAASAAGRVVFPLLYYGDDASKTFEKAFRDRYQRTPDYAAAYTYDTVRLLIDAVGQAGLNRARIRDAIREISPWPGVTGTVTWSPTGSNTREVRLGTISNGRVVPLPTTVSSAGSAVN